MRDLTLALEDLSDDLARAQVEISLMEQAIRGLATMIDRVEDARQDPLNQERLDLIFERLAAAQARQSSIAQLMEEFGGERIWRGNFADSSANAMAPFDALFAR